MTKRFLTAALLLAVSVIPAYAAKTSLVVGMPIEPPGLDPTIAAPVAIREVTWVNLYEGLVRIDRDGQGAAAPRQELGGLARRPDLHLPPAGGREVP